MNLRTETLVSISQTFMRYMFGNAAPTGRAIESYVTLVNHALGLQATPNEMVLARVELERRMIPAVSAKSWPHHELPTP